MWNTFTLAITQQAIALPVSLVLAWLFARTDLPGRGGFEFCMWVALFLPPITVTLAWILIFDEFNGIANRVLQHLPFVTNGPFNIHSWWGIVWIHLVTASIPAKVMLLTPIFRHLDASFEEAGWTLGSTRQSTLVRIVFPLLKPGILVVALLGLIRSLESFEIEWILGSPAQIQVYSTYIYRSLQDTPPSYGPATVMSVLILVVVVPLIILQQRFVSKSSHVTVTSKFRSNNVKLHAWKWPIFLVLFLICSIMTILPLACVIMATFMTRFGRFDARQVWTFEQWQSLLSNQRFFDALANTLIIGISAAFIATLVFSLIAYASINVRFKWKRIMDYLIWLPSAVPGIVLGLGYLWLFLGTPFLRPFYGTLAILVLVVSLSVMTLTMQMIKSSMLQVGSELEQASKVSGASFQYTFRRIIIPLVLPTIIVVGTLTFSNAARSTSYVALLTTTDNQPLSMFQLEAAADGRLELASTVGVVVTVLTLGIAMIGRYIGDRFGGVIASKKPQE
jgi:iron(III) transport system permease protein